MGFDVLENESEDKKNFTVNDLPDSEKPRERIRYKGAAGVSLQELLAAILGRGIRGESVMITAQRIIKKFNGNLNKMSETTMEELMQIRGIGVAKAAQLVACFELMNRKQQEEKGLYDFLNSKTVTSPEIVCEVLNTYVTDHTKEHFYTISLNIRNKIIAIEEISVGSLSASIAHPREIFHSAIKNHAAQIIIAHNHPSCDPNPSEEDNKITRRLYDAGKILGINLIDHIIFCKNGNNYSYKNNNVIF